MVPICLVDLKQWDPWWKIVYSTYICECRSSEPFPQQLAPKQIWYYDIMVATLNSCTAKVGQASLPLFNRQTPQTSKCAPYEDLDLNIKKMGKQAGPSYLLSGCYCVVWIFSCWNFSWINSLFFCRPADVSPSWSLTEPPQSWHKVASQPKLRSFHSVSCSFKDSLCFASDDVKLFGAQVRAVRMREARAVREWQGLIEDHLDFLQPNLIVLEHNAHLIYDRGALTHQVAKWVVIILEKSHIKKKHTEQFKLPNVSWLFRTIARKRQCRWEPNRSDWWPSSCEWQASNGRTVMKTK